jgi:hypothetical protein
VRTPIGHLRWIEVRGIVQHNPTGQPVRVVFPFLWNPFKDDWAALFRLLGSLELRSTTQDTGLEAPCASCWPTSIVMVAGLIQPRPLSNDEPTVIGYTLKISSAGGINAG